MTSTKVKEKSIYFYKESTSFVRAFQKIMSFGLKVYFEPPLKNALIQNKNGKDSIDGRVKTHLKIIYRLIVMIGWFVNKWPKAMLDRVLKISMKFGIDFSKVFMSGLPAGKWKENVSLVFLPDSKDNEVKTSEGKIVLPHQLVIEMLRRVCAYDTEHSIAQGHFCVCRFTKKCKNHPIGLGCMIVGPGAQNVVKRGIGKYITLEQAIKTIENVVMPQKLSIFISVLPSDLIYYWGVKPYYSKYTFEICSCCACCCVLKRPHFFVPREPVGDKPFVDIRGFRAVIDPKKCIGCGECISNCPLNKIKLVDVKQSNKIVKKAHNPDCIGCGNCVTSCPQNAVIIQATENFKHLEDLLGIFEYFDSDIDEVIKKAYEKYEK